MINNFIGATSGTNSDCTIHLKEGSNELLTVATRVHNNTDVEETTICVIEDLAAAAVLTITYDMGSGGCFAAVGTTFTVYKLNDDVKKRQEALDLVTSSVCVVNKASSEDAASEYNGFDEDNYSSADFDSRFSKNMVFNSGDGTFTIGTKGTYWIFYTAQISTASDAVVTTKIKLNGTAIMTAVAKIDSLNDPMNRTFMKIVNCVAGDSITTTVDSDSPNITHLAGSTMTIVRIPDWKHKETTGSSQISDDLTINTFSQGGLSAQRQRSADQVPFILGVKGPMSLRGRVPTNPGAGADVFVNNPYRITKGDKKS